MNGKRICAVGALVAGLMSGVAQAEGADILDASWTFKAGVMSHEVDAKLSATGPLGNRRQVDLDRLGLDDSEAVPYVSLRWDFTERWYLQGTYASFDDDGTVAAQRDVEFGDLVIPVGGQVSTDFELDLYILNAGYEVVSADRLRWDIGLGFHVMDMEFSIEGIITGGGQTVVGREQIDVTAPLPNLATSLRFALTDNLMLQGDIGWFGLEVDKFDGDLVTARLNVEWQPFRHLGFGVGYQHVDLDLDVDESRRNEGYEAEFKGPVAYVSWRI